MQEGIGRSGYRVIALVFFGLGVLGLATTLRTFGATSWFEWLGYGLLVVALVALLFLAMRVLAVRAPAADPARMPVLQPEPGLMPGPPAAADPSADLGVEYDDANADEPLDVEPEDLGPRSTAPPEQPRAPIVVPPRKPQGDTKGWPKRQGPSGVTRG